MVKFKVIGEQELSGEVKISGAKNAALKILPAAILANSPSTINNVPNISDINRLADILKSIGAKVEISGNSVTIDPQGVSSFSPEKSLVSKLRGSVVLLGPLLAKFGKVVFSQPGGCLIGSRPIDDHLDVFEQMGVKIHLEGDEYQLIGRPHAGEVILSKMSVTATENAMMAAVFSPGVTTIRVAAAEPEIADLAGYLNAMGAKISGAGTHNIQIEGVKTLRGVEYSVLPDRIEAGTFLIAAVATNSEITLGPVIPEHLAIVLRKLELSGAKFHLIQRKDGFYVKTNKRGEIRPSNIDTRTYPGFPTDLQSPYAVLMTQARGESRIFETLFEGRFLYLSELEKMGARFEVLSPHIIRIIGPTRLRGKEIICQDIRGGVSLVIAALVAKNTTTIERIEYIDRGYENLDLKLQSLGAKIERIT